MERAANVGAVPPPPGCAKGFPLLPQPGGYDTVINALQASGNPWNVLWVWALCQAGHVGFRYCGLASLRLRAINHKRGCSIAAAHAVGQPVPGDCSIARLTPLASVCACFCKAAC